MKLYFSFLIENFWSKKNEYNNVFFWHKRIAKNKSIELEIIKHSKTFFCLQADICFRGKDHAGPGVGIGMLGIEVWVQFYDHRHWDFQKNTWEQHDIGKSNFDGF